MYIEDLVRQLTLSRLGVNSSDYTVLSSFSDQFLSDTGLTEKQCGLALRILRRYSPLLSQKLGNDVTPFLDSPKYRLKIRKSVTDSTVSITKDKSDNPIISVRFPYSEEAITKIRKFKGEKNNSGKIEWDRDSTSWIFNLSEENIVFLMDFCNQGTFTFDEEFQNYVNTVNQVVLDLESHAPVLTIGNGEIKITNSPKNMPKIDKTDILEAVLQARVMGVTLWDDAIDQFLATSDINPVVKEYIKTPISEQFKINVDEQGISALNFIVANSYPCLVVIPGGSELEKITKMYSLLKGNGVDDKEMTVLFRLPNETGRKFNDFVKNQGLNGPISEETKIVFVSTKLPKPLIKSKLKFNSVVNMGYAMAHYTLKEYTKNHQNFINFGVSIKSEEFDFAKL